MKFKVRDIVDSIDENDLYKMQADLSKGGLFLKKIVDDKLKSMQNEKRGFCSTCGQSLDEKYKTYTILFGPEDFKKKASFCELDCLEYFLAGLKKINEDVKHNNLKHGDSNGI
jgi:hypothetical protein